MLELEPGATVEQQVIISNGYPTPLAVDVQGAQRTEMVMLTPDRRRTREFSVISLLNLLRRVLTSLTTSFSGKKPITTRSGMKRS